ncbi:DoxX family protein [Undibacterium sp. Ji22W]|uniref:DoxX family protein n=1 Tax=Undibacterium sp. Ji22W TaxID=3413038 RepID=UPI003BEFA4BA
MKKIFTEFPYLSVEQSLVVFRLTLAGLFMAHAAMRFFEPNYFHDFGVFLARRSVPFAHALPYIATAIEMIGGTFLIFNKFSRWVALGFFGISAGGIIIIHATLGWFVGEWGEGGCEYSVALCVMCLLMAAVDREKQKAKALQER